jgi:PAS domain S-box-containing protein
MRQHRLFRAASEIEMLLEASNERSVLLVARGTASRDFGTALAARDGIAVETVETTAAVESLLADQGVSIDCFVTDHDPPAVDAPAGIDAATDADIPSLAVGTERFGELGFDPFEAGASDYHRLEGEHGNVALAAKRIEQIADSHRESREREILAETVFEAPNIAMGVLDVDGTLVEVNDGALAFAGRFDEATVLGDPFWETPWGTRTSATSTELKTATERALAGETLQFEFTARDKHHNLIEVACSMHPIEHGGDVVGLLVIGEDITEKRSTGRRLRVLSRVLRHNLRNDLVAINGHAEFVEEQAADDVRDHATAIQRVTDGLVEKCELARRVQQALSVDRQPIPTVDVVSILSAELDRLSERNPDVEIERDVPESLSVRAEQGIDIAFRALLDNALEHNDAPTPWLRATVETVPAPTDASGTYHLDEAVEVRIADNGPGMPDHELSVLDEGVESELEHSSGLGLWASNWIVADSGGRLDFEATASGGTEVVITLPAVAEEP